MKRNFLFPVLAAAVFGTDQFLKHNVREGVGKTSGAAAGKTRVNVRRRLREKIPVSVEYSQNRGAAMNLGEKKPHIIRTISVFLCTMMTVLYIASLGMVGGDLFKAGFSLLLGGAYSNTFDRLKDKFVTDYIRFDFGPAAFRKIVFNIADFAIVIGSVITAMTMEEE